MCTRQIREWTGARAKAVVLAGSVGDRHMVPTDQELPEFGNVCDGQRVDNCKFIFRRDLQQTELGTITILGNEFGIEPDKRAARGSFAKFSKLDFCGYMLERNAISHDKRCFDREGRGEYALNRSGLFCSCNSLS